MTYNFSAILTDDTSVIGYIANFLNGAASFVIASGKVTNSYGIVLKSPITLLSSPCQDIAMLDYLEKERKNPPLYNLVLYNCIYWSLFAISQGMNEPSIGQCCNPDKSLYIPWHLINFWHE